MTHKANKQDISHHVRPCHSHVLSYASTLGRRHVGVLMPGHHRLGRAAHGQEIRVLEGEARINGRTYGTAPGDVCHINIGDIIEVEAFVPTPYFCKFIRR